VPARRAAAWSEGLIPRATSEVISTTVENVSSRVYCHSRLDSKMRGQHVADERLAREVDGWALAPKFLQDLVAPDARAGQALTKRVIALQDAGLLVRQAVGTRNVGGGVAHGLRLQNPGAPVQRDVSALAVDALRAKRRSVQPLNPAPQQDRA
jgi:hypothetical protein